MGTSVKGLAVLGSTGSIGRQALDVVRGLRRRFRVVALAAGRNVTLLEEQAREFLPKLVYWEGNERPSRGVIAFGGASWASLEEMAVHPEVDILVVATSGKAGLFPTLAALRAGKSVALANKEALVMAGKLVMEAAAAGKGEIRPIDSEHSAIWQCLRGERVADANRLILTASGGAFRDKSLEELRLVTPEEALRHPTWRMGRKITIDSATLLNKGLEAIEAHWLFGVPLERIEIVMHRESIIHSLVEFTDGSVKAQLGPPDMRLPIQHALCQPGPQLGPPDMRLPIQYALSYSERLPLPSLPRLDLGQIGALHFEKLDLKRFPCLVLALEAGHRGGTYPAVLTAADEVAVEYFLAGRIGFMDIASVIGEALEAHEPVADPSLDEILSADAWARERAGDLVRAKT